MNVFSSIAGLAGYSYTMYVFTSTVLFVSDLHSVLPASIAEKLIVAKMDGDGTQNDVAGAVVGNVICLSIFAVQHTIMAREFYKKAVTTFLPACLERIQFSVTAACTLHYMLRNWKPIPEVLFEFPASMTNLMMGLHLVGWAVMLSSTFMLDHFALFGLSQAVRGVSSVVPEGEPILQRTALYNYVRHPLMSGFMLAFWLFPKYSIGRVMFATITSTYILLAVKFLEEPALQCLLGKQYTEYMETTPAYCPALTGRKGKTE